MNLPVPLSNIPKLPATLLLSKIGFNEVSMITLLGLQAAKKMIVDDSKQMIEGVINFFICNYVLSSINFLFLVSYSYLSTGDITPNSFPIFTKAAMALSKWCSS